MLSEQSRLTNIYRKNNALGLLEICLVKMFKIQKNLPLTPKDLFCLFFLGIYF